MRSIRRFGAQAVVVLALAASVRAENYKGFERAEALITPGELKTLIDDGDPKLVLIGVVRGGLTGPFTRGHIAGAYRVWRPDYTTQEGDPYPYGGMMVNREKFQNFARSLGIDDDSKIVLYDERLDATRLWWAFYLYGKTDARILDGGYAAWIAAGYDTERGNGAKRGSRRGGFVARSRRAGWVWSMEEVWRAKSDTSIQLWDTREPEEWSGEQLLRGASRRGRVGWARFLNWKEFRKKVRGGTPTEFKTSKEIQAILDREGFDENKHQLFYCQSGVRTTTEIFALYLMGWDPDKLHNYDGSWAEWSYYKENPVVTD